MAGVGAGMTEEEEQELKYEESIELLLAAGYFRVRIASLSKFDKVVGGLAWCITNSGIAADVNVLFQENSTIGQKIKIADTIIKALHKMECPFPLASQHIQGGNFVALHPAIQWLVRKVLENRAETGDYIRRYSVSQFNKFNRLAVETQKRASLRPAVSYAAHVNGRYKPKRGFRPTVALQDRPAKEQASSVLLEFGHRYRLSVPTETSEEERARLARLAAEEGERLASMMGTLSEVGGRAINTAKMGAMFGEKDQIRALADQHELQAELLERKRIEDKETQFQREKANLERRIEAAGVELEEITGRHAEAEATNAEGRERLRTKVEYNERVIAETEKLLALETDENREDVARLRQLLSLCDNLEIQQKLFIESCRRQREYLETEIERLRVEGPPQEIARRLAMLQHTHATEEEKLVRLRAAMAKKLRDIALVERRIDELPSRVELNQYQRRFVELYDQMAAKHIETKQYYATYNTLNTSHNYLIKEVTSLENLNESYPQFMRQKKTGPKEQFVEHITTLHDSLTDNLAKINTRYKSQKAARDDMNSEYLQLVEAQRLYFQMAKDFQEECRKNEFLGSQLAELA